MTVLLEQVEGTGPRVITDTNGAWEHVLMSVRRLGRRVSRVRTVLSPLLAAATLLLSSLLLLSTAQGRTVPSCLSILSEPGREAQAVALLRAMLSTENSCVTLSGRFPLAAPLRISNVNSGLHIHSSAKEPAILVAVLQAKRGMDIIAASDVTIEGIVLVGFAHDGIFANNSRNLTIRSVTVIETGSTAWSQGSIHLTGTSTGALVETNTIQGANFAGIVVDTDAASDVSNITIRNNRVTRSCRRVHDCGAIYVNDRGRRSRNILIVDNFVDDFGPISVGGRGIYIDDWASYVTVRGNRIAGPGRFAFQIHGGHNNFITGNSIEMADIASPLVYEAAIGGTRATMTKNVVTDNVFTHRAVGHTAFTPGDQVGAGAVRLQRNRQCDASRCIPIP